jgi:hypothetical protein
MLAIFLSSSALNASSIFDELDKPPEGVHEGQMIAAAFISMGAPFGGLIARENDFIKGSTYTFSTNETTKLIELTSLSFNTGASFEYMPIDHVGLKTRLKNGFVVQRSTFGTDYKNWSETLMSDFSMQFGVPLHLTSRKLWDAGIFPYAGYHFADITVVPVGAKLLDGYEEPGTLSASGYNIGTELFLSVFFTGGFALSFGADWTYYSLTADKDLHITNPQTRETVFYEKETSLHTVNFTLSAGYTFDN